MFILVVSTSTLHFFVIIVFISYPDLIHFRCSNDAGYCRTDCLFSPDDRLVVTGTSVKKGEGCGKLVVLDRLTLARVAELDAAPQTVGKRFKISRMGDCYNVSNLHFCHHSVFQVGSV